MSERLNITDTIARQENFSTFSRLMASAGANDVFKGQGPFTVFVPTNEAFSKVPVIIMNELLNEPDQTQLRALLSYHILPIKVMAANIGASPTRTACTGEELRFADSNGLKVNGAIVLARNIEATNGVVHSLNTVLAPSTGKPKPIAKAAIASSQSAAVHSVDAASTGTKIPTPTGSTV